MTDLTQILLALVDGQVDFVLVDGLAAVSQGAPVTTFDVDSVHDRSPANVGRLVSVLARLGRDIEGAATICARPPGEVVGRRTDAWGRRPARPEPARMRP